MRIVIVFLAGLLLVACGDSDSGRAPTCPSTPSAPVGIIQGYNTSAGHDTTINVWSEYGASGAKVVAVANEGDEVWVLGRRNDGGVHIETKSCVQGWIDSEFIK